MTPTISAPRPTSSAASRISIAPRPISPVDEFDGFGGAVGFDRLDEPATGNVLLLLRVSGALEVPALTSAVRDVVAGHDSLRPLSVERGVLAMPVIHLRWDDLTAAAAEAAVYRFDRVDRVAGGPVRPYLFRCGHDEHVLLLIIDRRAVDDAALAPLARELESTYSAMPRSAAPQWSVLPVRYRDR